MHLRRCDAYDLATHNDLALYNMPSPSSTRLRSKTSDLSDLLHGRPKPSTDSDAPPVPLTLTPLKSKGKLAGFLARKRKSGIAGAQDAFLTAQRDEDSTDIEVIPAIPHALATRCVLFSIAIASAMHLICIDL